MTRRLSHELVTRRRASVACFGDATSAACSCVHSRIGKDWAKGLTAATDQRIARNAAAHVGLTYRTGRATADPPAWTDDLAYAVGLIATDGCLSRDGRDVIFVSRDEALVESFIRCAGHPRARITSWPSSAGTPIYRVQLSDVRFYQWLISLGLHPAKSLTLGALAIPSEHFTGFVRGLLDGDGTIYVLRHRPTRKAQPGYWYERLWTYFTSASRAHIDWLRGEVTRLYGLRGYIETTRRQGRHAFYRLKFGNRESLKLLSILYADPTAPALQRKRDIWLAYLRRSAVVRKEGLEPSRPCGQ